MGVLASKGRLRLLLVIIGAGAFFCSVYYTYFTSALSPFGMYSTSQAQFCWSISNPAQSIAHFCWIILYAVQPDLAEKPALHRGLSWLWATGQVVMVVGANADIAVLMAAGALSMGIGMTAVAIRWCYVLAGEDAADLKVIFSFVAILAVVAVVLLLPHVVQTAAAVLLPALSFACLEIATRSTSAGKAAQRFVPTPSHQRAIGGSIWALVLVVGIIWMCHTFLEGHTTSSLGMSASPYLIVFVFGSVIAVAVSVASLWFGRGPWFTSLYIFSVPLMIVALFLAALMKDDGFVPYLFEFAAVLSSTMFVWTAGVDLARKGVFSPVISVSLFRGMYYVGQTALVSLFFSATGNLSFEMQCFSAVCILALATVVSLCGKSEYALPHRQEGHAETTEKSEELHQSVETADETPIELLAQTYGMTEREREVFELLVHGRSVTYIMESLYISRNTVNSHVKHIYQKLGVHSKQQMLDLVEDGLFRDCP